jgi:hypothetical protein
MPLGYIPGKEDQYYDEEYDDEEYYDDEDQGQYRDENAELMQICIRDPIEMNGRIYYSVTGFDRLGKFETKRRYNDFIALHTSFRERLPGLYIPALPPKKAFGNLKSEFLDERSFHLE